MKIAVELATEDVEFIRKLTGEKRKDLAVAKFIRAELALSRRREIDKKILAGEISAEITIQRHPRDYDAWSLSET